LALFYEKSTNDISKYKQKVMDEVTEVKHVSIYPAIRKLGMRPGETRHAQLQLFTCPCGEEL
jgi:hypothetical protein